MAGGDCEEYATVSLMFDKYLKLYEEMEKSDIPTNDEQLQNKIKEGVDGLIKATLLISELGVFSSNETLEELPTSSIKFLLLPVLLGTLSLKRTDVDRLEVLRISNIYFRDFVQRCKLYGITDIELPKDDDEENDEDNSKETKKEKVPSKPSIIKNRRPTPEELGVMARQRNDKIKRFKERKATGDRLAELKKAISNPSHDEELLRDYFVTMTKKFILDSIEEIDSIAMERKMLREMATMRMKGNLPETSKEAMSNSQPLRPFLITRDALQKKVYGMGYPSLPTLTVDDFYNQRVKDGWYPDPSKDKNSLQDRALAGPEAEKEAEETEEREKEEAEERDDPVKIARERERDEWRDTHKRGWGNTYNRS